MSSINWNIIKINHRHFHLKNLLSVGSLFYIAPEIKNKEFYNSKIDIYSLGVCFEKMYKKIFPPRNEIDEYKIDEFSLVEDLIARMLCSVEARISHDELDSHEFFDYYLNW